MLPPAPVPAQAPGPFYPPSSAASYYDARTRRRRRFLVIGAVLGLAFFFIFFNHRPRGDKDHERGDDQDSRQGRSDDGDRHHDPQLASLYLKHAQCRSCLWDSITPAQPRKEIPWYLPNWGTKWCAQSGVSSSDNAGVCQSLSAACEPQGKSIVSGNLCPTDLPQTKMSCSLCVLDAYSWCADSDNPDGDEYAGQCVKIGSFCPSKRLSTEFHQCRDLVYKPVMRKFWHFGGILVILIGLGALAGILFFIHKRRERMRNALLASAAPQQPPAVAYAAVPAHAPPSEPVVVARPPQPQVPQAPASWAAPAPYAPPRQAAQPPVPVAAQRSVYPQVGGSELEMPYIRLQDSQNYPGLR